MREEMGEDEGEGKNNNLSDNNWIIIYKSINNYLEIHRMRIKVSFNTYLLILVYFVILCLILSLSLLLFEF